MPLNPRDPVLWAVVLGVLLVVGTVVVRSGRDPEPATTALPTTTSPASPPCGAIATTDTTGRPLPEVLLGPAGRVHDAACRRDLTALAAEMEESFGGRTPAEAVRALDGAPEALPRVARVLEVPPRVEQGGHVYCGPEGDVVVFARGTLDRPGRWSLFEWGGTAGAAGWC
ncbi:hypothetical protein [Saccharothrix obliqua]|uniref:hypothetical protein n=1 Tax=Saccharothrix obliqua TaxID=2861747 RepID=UPI001C5F5B04|nr:hypothetical protein [Saccharothrix obliqua]MBW4721972.1 hypothetical protein [Saccharothrix obliqua]